MQILLPFFTSFPQFNELIKRFANLLIECNVQDTMAPYIPQQSNAVVVASTLMWLSLNLKLMMLF